jgi:hypothetical protein
MVADDCPVTKAEIPPQKKEEKTIASLQYEMIVNNPYKYTSDDVIFEIYAIKNNIPKFRKESEREKFFSKGQACLRSSPLTKRYGWGIHSNKEGKIALVPLESTEYKGFCNDKTLTIKRAMKSKK